jgi:SAM-dependent methyltransferase
MPKRRSLSETNHKLLEDSTILQDTLAALAAARGDVRVLEVGFGEGLALAELAWQFRAGAGPAVEFFGVDKLRRDCAATRQDLLRHAVSQGLVPSDAVERAAPIELAFYDATQLQCADNSIDLVYSVMVVRFIEDKAQFLEEVCRALRPGGVALVQVGESHWKYPSGTASDDLALTPHPSRLVLRHGRELVPLDAYLKLFESDSIEFEFINRPRCVLKIAKRQPCRLDLRLMLDRDHTVAMSRLPYRHGSGKSRGGIRSVYHVAPDVYRQLASTSLRKSVAAESPRQAAGVHTT